MIPPQSYTPFGYYDIVQSLLRLKMCLCAIKLDESDEGCWVGCWMGCRVGWLVGWLEGCCVGIAEGTQNRIVSYSKFSVIINIYHIIITPDEGCWVGCWMGCRVGCSVYYPPPTFWHRRSFPPHNLYKETQCWMKEGLHVGFSPKSDDSSAFRPSE